MRGSRPKAAWSTCRSRKSRNFSIPVKAACIPCFASARSPCSIPGSDIDDTRLIFEKYRDFDLRIVRQAWGIKLEIKNAPAAAFVDGVMIRGLKDHLFAVLRDVVFISNEIMESGRFDLTSSSSITNAVFHILRNARVLELQMRPNLVVCWGGHSIRRIEYDYTKKVGYELGLRSMDVCTGCGPGAMKGPMKGATIGHSKQRIVDGRYLGVTEPGIIAAEPPNPIVSQLVIMPDIEKRLEAFVRLGHGIVIFPGAQAPPRKSCICSAFCSIRPIAICRFPWFSRVRRTAPIISNKSIASSARPRVRLRSPATR